VRREWELEDEACHNTANGDEHRNEGASPPSSCLTVNNILVEELETIAHIRVQGRDNDDGKEFKDEDSNVNGLESDVDNRGQSFAEKREDDATETNSKAEHGEKAESKASPGSMAEAAIILGVQVASHIKHTLGT